MTTRAWTIAALISLCGLQGEPAAQSAPPGIRPVFPFPLVDQAKQDPEFAAFRDSLLAAARKRDASALAASMDRELQSREHAWLSPPFSNTIAFEVERALALGGAFTETRGAVLGRREFCAPYVYGAFPNQLPDFLDGEGDPWAIVGSHVPVRAQRSPSARTVTYLSWELVKADAWLDADPESHLRWAEVTLPSGRSGFVQELQIRRTTDYHVCFAKIDGAWRMTTFARDQHPARG